MNPVTLGEITVQGRPEFVGALRNFARDVVGVVHPEVVDAVQLISSELGGNAVQYTRSREPGEVVRLRVEDEGATVRLAVTDRGGATTVPVVVEDEDPLEVGGRGLWLVRSLSKEWGVETAPDGGTTVWSRIDAGAGATTPDCW
jgi:anti-sigma regulatory factor (Ser/Thr protein kinase)